MHFASPRGEKSGLVGAAVLVDLRSVLDRRSPLSLECFRKFDTRSLGTPVTQRGKQPKQPSGSEFAQVQTPLRDKGHYCRVESVYSKP